MDPPPHRHITTRSHHHNHNRPSTSFGGGREDCWTESATETLIEAWGDRYIKVNRGNLRQKDWKEVADAVNSRQNGVKKTDVQCKNRIDTLKKKYKLEKAKPPPSTWPFYHRLDSLIGTNAVNKKPTTVTFTIKSSKPKPVESKSTANSVDDGDEDEDDNNQAVVKKEVVELSDGAASRELARSILKFGEIYERIESLKQQQMMELERERMEITKDVEFQRMNMFVDTQLEIEKLNRQNYKDRSGSGSKMHIVNFAYLKQGSNCS